MYHEAFLKNLRHLLILPRGVEATRGYLLVDLQATATFWQAWKDFEVAHGNEETVREMLRIKRSVQATFNTQVNFMSTQMLAAQTSRDADDSGAAGAS